MRILSQPQLHEETAAFAYVEAQLWPQGPVCPHCGGVDRFSAIKPNPAKRVRIGLKFCGQCRKQFTVRVGTIFEDSQAPHIPMGNLRAAPSLGLWAERKTHVGNPNRRANRPLN